MKLHSIILRILIALGVLPGIVMSYLEWSSFSASIFSWSYYAGELICIVCLFLPWPSTRLLGAGGLAFDMLTKALGSLHALTNFYPAPASSSGAVDNLLMSHVLESFLGLLLVPACIAVIAWEVRQLKNRNHPQDPEEDGETTGGWDEGGKNRPGSE